MKKIDKIEVAKELMKTKVDANFSHYTSGNLYYTVNVLGSVYQFPIETVEIHEETEIVNDAEVTTQDVFLSTDLGSTSFSSVMRGSELNRWIRKAIDKDEFIKIG